MLIVMLAMALLICVFMIVIAPMVMVGAPTSAEIKIPRNATTKNLEDTLTKYFDRDYASTVTKMVKMRNVDLKKRHGLYKIEEGTNALNTMRRLTSGAETPVRITINGFRSLPLLIDRISSRLDLTPDSLWAVVSDPEFTASYGLTPEQALALFTDNTYELYWSSSARDAVRKIADSYRLFWSETNRRKAEALGLSPARVVILSSIVDEETNANREKGLIGRLYINRLNKGMRLQADPTVKYAVGDFTLRRITSKHLQVQSPYNTYIHQGLPPGPIRTPDLNTVRIILNSEPNDYLYMCAKEDFSGTHNFATTFTEHTQNAIRYRHALDRNNIR